MLKQDNKLLEIKSILTLYVSSSEVNIKYDPRSIPSKF